MNNLKKVELFLVSHLPVGCRCWLHPHSFQRRPRQPRRREPPSRHRRTESRLSRCRRIPRSPVPRVAACKAAAAPWTRGGAAGVISDVSLFCFWRLPSRACSCNCVECIGQCIYFFVGPIPIRTRVWRYSLHVTSYLAHLTCRGGNASTYPFGMILGVW